MVYSQNNVLLAFCKCRSNVPDKSSFHYSNSKSTTTYHNDTTIIRKTVIIRGKNSSPVLFTVTRNNHFPFIYLVSAWNKRDKLQSHTKTSLEVKAGCERPAFSSVSVLKSQLKHAFCSFSAWVHKNKRKTTTTKGNIAISVYNSVKAWLMKESLLSTLGLNNFICA